MNIYHLYLFLIVAIFFCTSWILYHKWIPFLRFWSFDIPSKRSSHSSPTPSSGGIVFFLMGNLGAVLFGNIYTLIFSPLALVSFIDDRNNVNQNIRFWIQLLSVVSLLKIYSLQNKFLIPIYDFTIPITLLFIVITIACVGIINFFNFMDGIDGLLAGSMSLILLTLGIKDSPSLLPLAGSLIAFLVWNWHPAKLFMGDVGSTFLGAIYVSCLLGATDLEEAIGLLLIASPILLDSLTCLLRRIYYKQNIFQAHNSHLYQRLHQAGLSHRTVTLIYIILTLFLCIIFLFSNLLIYLLALFFEIMIGFFLHINFAKRFNY
tara:strand:- start:10519 stop:11475 length:957 start_codon:yes stop_codon:yes gene_type:complete